MSDVTTPELTRAYQLIETDQLDQARIVLDTYLESHRDDADAWWLYAHAVTDPMEAQNALRNVLRLVPDYPGARALLAESEQILTPAQGRSGTTGITRLASRPVSADDANRAPDFLDQMDDEIDFGDFDSDDTGLDNDFDDEFGDEDELGESEEDAPARVSRYLQLLLIAALVFVVLIALVWAITGSSRNRNTVVITPSVTSPAVVVVITDTPTPTVSLESTTELNATPEEQFTAVGTFDAIYDAMSSYSVVPDSAIIESTSLGSTLLISVCNDPGTGLATTALNALETLSFTTDAVVNQVEYTGVRVVDCTRDNLILRTLAVSISDAQAYQQGTLTLNQLRAKVKPISQ